MSWQGRKNSFFRNLRAQKKAFFLTLQWAARRKRRRLLRAQQAKLVHRARGRLKIIVMTFGIVMTIPILRTAFLYTGRNESHLVPLHGKGPYHLPILQSRADIVDIRGNILATSVPVDQVFIKPKENENPMVLAENLHTIYPDLEVQNIKRRIAKGKSFIWISRQSDNRQSHLLRQHTWKGVYIVKSQKRIYPTGSLFSHIVGYVDPDQRGLGGLEYGLDKRLRHSRRPVQVTLDTNIQYAVTNVLQRYKRSLRAKHAVGIVVNTKTGAILALVSLPNFDPAYPERATDEELFSRATLGHYEMGSVFKIFTVAMALDSGKARLGNIFPVRDPIRLGPYRIRDADYFKSPTLDLVQLFIHSSNIGTVHLLMQVGLTRGKKFLQKLDLNNTKNLPIPETSPPLYPKKWGKAEMITTSYGYGIAPTPLQFVMGAAAIVNGGTRILPKILVGYRGGLGKRIISPYTSIVVRKLLRLVVTDGSGKTANVPGYLVGGKTGTALQLKKNGAYGKRSGVFNFVAFFPVNNPTYAVYVLIDSPGVIPVGRRHALAGKTVGPAVADIIDRIAPLLGVGPKTGKDKKFVDGVHRLAVAYLQDE